MAKDQVLAFAEKAKSDPAIHEKLKEIPQGPDSMDYVVNVAKDAGFNFTAQELEEASKQKAQSGEISQEDLDKISGGTLITVATMFGITVVICPSPKPR